MKLKTFKVLRFDVKNLNDRVYTRDQVEPLLEGLNKKASDGVLFGQLGFPESSILDFSKISHKIHNVYIEDDFLMAKIEFLDNELGRLIKEENDQYVFRSRSSGSINEDTKVVQLKEIFTFDAVLKETDSFIGLMD